MAVYSPSDFRVLSPIIAGFCMEVKGLAGIGKSNILLRVKRCNRFSEVAIQVLLFFSICTNTFYFRSLRKSDSDLRRFSFAVPILLLDVL